MDFPTSARFHSWSQTESFSDQNYASASILFAEPSTAKFDLGWIRKCFMALSINPTSESRFHTWQETRKLELRAKSFVVGFRISICRQPSRSFDLFSLMYSWSRKDDSMKLRYKLCSSSVHTILARIGVLGLWNRHESFKSWSPHTIHKQVFQFRARRGEHQLTLFTSAA